MHCISIYIIKKSELRDSKIDSILNDETITSEIKWVELSCDLFATTYIPNIEKFGENRIIAKINTDYFGGIGYQRAKLFVNNKLVMNYQSEHLGDGYVYRPINSVLKELGVNRTTGIDEFDMVGLGNYRCNDDFDSNYLTISYNESF